MLERAFEIAFSRPLEVETSAPGRVNLLGEHTDYNEGLVLPTVIPQRTWVGLARRDDARVTVRSETLGQTGSYEIGREKRGGTFLDYVQGVTAALAELDHAVGGFDAVIATEIPLGSGLSSSAALSIALLRALRRGFGLDLDDVMLAKIAQRAENGIVGAPVGILDPMATSLGEPGYALFIDTRKLAYERIPLPADAEIVIVDSGVAHDHATGDYKTRRRECEEAATLLGVKALRDVGEQDLARIGKLPPPLDRRARHVVTENARVERAVAALRRGDVAELGHLFYASHASMRDDFEVSVPAVDEIVERARKDDAVFGARLTGGGFGGAVVALARAGQGAAVGRRLERERARCLVPNREVAHA